MINPANLYQNKSYSLSLQSFEEQTHITMQLLTPVFDTKHMPQTFKVVSKFIPNILNSKCFNYKNQPFGEELKATPLAHLFEHILLEYLADLKRSDGHKGAVYNGLTKWDWNKDAKGIFRIEIDAGKKDSKLINVALAKTIFLLNAILLPTIQADKRLS